MKHHVHKHRKTIVAASVAASVPEMLDSCERTVTAFAKGEVHHILLQTTTSCVVGGLLVCAFVQLLCRK